MLLRLDGQLHFQAAVHFFMLSGKIHNLNFSIIHVKNIERMFTLFKNQDGQVRSGWVIAFALLMVFIGQTIFSLPGLTFISIYEISKAGMEIEISMDNLNPWMLLFVQGSGTFGGIAATLVVFRAIHKKNPTLLGFSGKPKDLFFGLFLGAIAITVMFGLLFISGNIQLTNALSAPYISENLLIFLILFILVGVFEEAFFRGYIMNAMAERGNQKWVIYLTSAVIFGMVHLSNPNVKFLGILNVILIGILFAYMFDKTKSLLLPIGFHITWNYFQGTVFGFPVSGTAPYGMYDIDVSGGSDWLTGGNFGLEGGLLTTLMIVMLFGVVYLYTRNRKSDYPILVVDKVLK